MPSTKSYLPEIDTLRALAVVMVVIFHAFPAWMPGGFIGVDIFFVISGFVISRSYLDPLVTGETRLRDFYLARFRRLAPALFVVLAVSAVAALYLALPAPLTRFGESLAAQPFYVQNFVFWNQGDYFESGITKPLLHTWSLAVEEQFYILFGLLILLGLKVPRAVLPVLLLASLISFVVGVMVTPVSPKTPFFMVFTRIWQFGLGILAFRMAQGLSSAGGRWNHSFAAVGIVMCFYAGLAFGEDSAFPGTQAIIAGLGTIAALVAFDTQRRSLGLFKLAPATYIGRLSYGFYLWHWPPISFFYLSMERAPTYPEAAFMMACALTISAISYHLVETPIRQQRVLGGPRRIVVFTGTTMALTFAAGIALIGTKGALMRYPAEVRPYFEAAMERTPFRCGKVFRMLNPNAEMCPINGLDRPGGVLLLGDSHVDMLDDMLAEIAETRDVPLYLAVRNCDFGMFVQGRGKSFCSEKVLRKVINEAVDRGVTTVVAISYWRESPSAVEALSDAGPILDAGLRLVLVEDVPWDPGYSPEDRAVQALKSGLAVDRSGISVEEYDAQRSEYLDSFRSVAAVNLEQVRILSQREYFCPDGECAYADNYGRPLYTDSNHLSYAGRAVIRPLYESLFDAFNNPS